MPAYSQEFRHSAGIVFSVLSYPKRTNESYKRTFSQGHFLYFLKYIISEDKNTSYSIGIPLSVGGSIGENKNNERSAGAAMGLSCNIPVIVDYNFGYNSTSENQSKTGGFMGLGIDYFTFLFPKNTGINSLGPLVRSGFCWHGRKNGMSISVSYKKGFESIQSSTFGISYLAKRL